MNKFKVTMCGNEDIYVEKAELDGSKLVLTRTDKEKLEVDLSGLVVTSKDTYVASAALANNVLTLTKNDATTVDVDLSGLVPTIPPQKDTYVESGSYAAATGTLELMHNDRTVVQVALPTPNTYITEGVLDGGKLKLKRNDNSEVEIDVSKLVNGPDNYVSTGSVINGNTLKLNFKDGTHIDIDLSSLITPDVFVKSGRLDDTNIVLTMNNNKEVNIDVSDLVNRLIGKVANLQYAINNQAGDYTLTQDDYNGFTIIRGTSEQNQTITLTKPTDDKIGRVVTIRKAAGDLGTLLFLKPAADVTFSPTDASPLRRVGNTVTAVYVGNGVFDLHGELP